MAQATNDFGMRGDELYQKMLRLKLFDGTEPFKEMKRNGGVVKKVTSTDNYLLMVFIRLLLFFLVIEICATIRRLLFIN